VRRERGDVHNQSVRFDPVQVFTHRAPLPIDRLRRHPRVNSAQYALGLAVGDRGAAQAAVADDGGGDALGQLAAHQFGLSFGSQRQNQIGVRMRIDDARNDGTAPRFYRLFCFGVELSDRRDAVAFDCDVSSVRRQTCTIDNDSVLNRYVIHNDNYNAARRLDFKSKSLARRIA
jgi:hypothetical protein